MTIDSNTYAVTRRQYLPFGQTRGSAPTTWPGGDKGYVGGTFDPSTGLENLGAREYDPGTGRFLSSDPTFEASDPTQMGGYDYSGNDPVTNSDPTGLRVDDTIPGLNAYVSAPAGDPSTPRIQYYALQSIHAWEAGAANRAYWQAWNHKHPPVIPKPPAPSCHGFWGCAFHALKSVGTTVLNVASAAAPIITTVAVATSFIPGVDLLTGAAAAAVTVLNVASSVVGALSTVSSVVSVGEDIANGTIGTAGGVADVLSLALGAEGVRLGGVTGLGGAAKTAEKAATKATEAFKNSQRTLENVRTLAGRGGAVGSAAKSALPALRQTKNIARSGMEAAETRVTNTYVLNKLYTAAGADVTEGDDYLTGNGYTQPLASTPGLGSP